jgi:prevent-host-death family protein
MQRISCNICTYDIKSLFGYNISVDDSTRPDLVYIKMNQIINIQAAKTHLSRLVEEVLAGADIVLAKAGKPLVRMVPYKAAKSPRVGGQFAGRVSASEDCWAPDESVFGDAPLVVTATERKEVSYLDAKLHSGAHRRALKLAEGPPPAAEL